MANTKLTWLGHASLLIESPEGKKVLVDPWLDGNPSCPEAWQSLERYTDVDVVLLTHGHFDHVGAVMALCEAHKPVVCCMVELGVWLEQKGVENVSSMNKGGSQEFAGIRFTMTTANHSSSMVEEDGTIVYLGEPNGYVLDFGNGRPLYIAGDTNVFGDMALIAELYQPTAAVLPIGDHFTMGELEAAKAAQLLNVKSVVPVHHSTFPLLTGTPAGLRERVGSDVDVVEIAPGETIEL